MQRKREVGVLCVNIRSIGKKYHYTCVLLKKSLTIERTTISLKLDSRFAQFIKVHVAFYIDMSNQKIDLSGCLNMIFHLFLETFAPPPPTPLPFFSYTFLTFDCPPPPLLICNLTLFSAKMILIFTSCQSTLQP